MGKTSTERMRALRKRRKESLDKKSMEEHQEKERKRAKRIRDEKRKAREADNEKQEEYRKFERLRKRKQRQKNKVEQNVDGRAQNNKKTGASRRKNNEAIRKQELKKMHLKVKIMTNQNRRLKRKLAATSTPASSYQSTSASEDLDVSSSASDASFINALSPSAKRRARKRLSITKSPREIVRRYHLDRQAVEAKRDSNLKILIEKYFLRDDVSMITPDLKKAKKGIRYRLASLQELHERFEADESIECSYAHFTRYVPNFVIKPKPEDWGTCLCMPCLNPELKLEAVKRTLPGVQLTLEEVTNDETDKVDALIKEIRESGKVFKYLEWTKQKEPSQSTKVTTYHSKKVALADSSEKFAAKLKSDFDELYEHSRRFRSQYRRIKEIKQLICDPDSNCKMLRIDWSENVDLYQTRQEKSQYYTTISASVNTAVLYERDSTQSFGTISDVKSHKADATWASLRKIFSHIDFSDCKHLFIVSDSPTSQYRNKNNILLMKDWAVSNKIQVSWVFTESGHGKGPMDGVGSGIKRAVKDTISYHPNAVIRDTAQLMKYLPTLNNIEIETYNEEDVLKARKGYGVENIDSVKITSNGIGVSLVHKIFCDINDTKQCQWKALSEDKEFKKAHWEKVNAQRLPVVENSNDSDTDADVSEESEKEIESNTEEEFPDITKSQKSINSNHIGKYYCIYYDQGEYWGRLIKVNDERRAATFKFLSYKCGFWEFPRKSTDEEVDITYVFHGPCQPSSVTKTGYKFNEDQVIATYNKLKRRNNAK